MTPLHGGENFVVGHFSREVDVRVHAEKHRPP